MTSSSFASSSLVSSSEYPDIPDKYSPPPSSFAFPKRSFWIKKNCAEVLPGGHGWSCGCGFIIVKVKMCCFVVYVLVPLNPKKWVKVEEILLSLLKGFSNWKDGTIGIKKHEVSGSHKGALQVMVVMPSTCHDV